MYNTAEVVAALLQLRKFELAERDQMIEEAVSQAELAHTNRIIQVRSAWADRCDGLERELERYKSSDTNNPQRNCDGEVADQGSGPEEARGGPQEVGGAGQAQQEEKEEGQGCS